MTEFRCWQCGIEAEPIEVTTFGDPEPRYIPLFRPWEADHEHSVNPPTPEELIERGYRSLNRIMKEWL